MKMDTIKIGVDLDMQELYDSLMIYKNSIEAQIKSLGENPSICTHVKTEDFNGITVCSNNHCHKVINTNGLYDWTQ